MTVPSAVAVALRAETVVAGVLVEMDFATGLQRVWSGIDPLTTSDGRVWSPVAHFGGVSELEEATALEAAGFTIGLRRPGEVGSDSAAAFAAAVQEARAEDVFGRDVTVYLQAFDAATGAAVGAPQAVAAAIMVQVEDSFDGAGAAAIRVQCEHVLAPGRVGSAGWMTDVDQQARHPGDRGLALTSVIGQRRVRWPRD